MDSKDLKSKRIFTETVSSRHANTLQDQARFSKNKKSKPKRERKTKLKNLT
jgi:hypothetical protein